MTEDEMVGWHHQLNGHKFEQAQRVGGGQGSLACCSPWGRKESDMTKQLYILLSSLRVRQVPFWLKTAHRIEYLSHSLLNSLQQHAFLPSPPQTHPQP